MKLFLNIIKYSIFLFGLFALLYMAFISFARIGGNPASESEVERLQIETALQSNGFPCGSKYEVVGRFKSGACNRLFKIALDGGAPPGFPKSDPPFRKWKKYSELEEYERRILDFALGVQTGKEILAKDELCLGDFLVAFTWGKLELNELRQADFYLYKYPHFYILERKIK